MGFHPAFWRLGQHKSPHGLSTIPCLVNEIVFLPDCLFSLIQHPSIIWQCIAIMCEIFVKNQEYMVIPLNVKSPNFCVCV